MMQQQPQMIPAMQSIPPTNLTTEQIQKYLDENRKLILAIMDNQNLGKVAECAQYQAVLQKNLMYLAAIADAQPQATPIMAPQMAPHPAMQQGAYFTQQPQAAAFAQQPGQKTPIQFNNPHQQHPQAIQGQMGIGVGPGGSTNGGGGNGGTNGQASDATGRGGDGTEHGK